jgi:predicted nuclease of predicted toxin-antitoxin system
VRFLADEGFDSRVVDALRAAGHDVMAVAVVAKGARDSDVLDLAHREARVLLTEDRDFGQLVYASGLQHSIGVLYVRCPERDRPMLPTRMVSLVDRLGPSLHESFVVWAPNRCRVRRYEPQ